MLKEVKNGKCKHLIVFSFSRFSRSCSHLLKSLEFLEGHNCKFSSVSEQIETATIMGRTLVAVLGALGEMERALIVERVKSGLARAKAEGKHIGRKKTRPTEMIRKVLMRGETFRRTAYICKTSSGSVSIEAKEIREEFRSGQLPKHLTIDDIRQSTFFVGEKKENFEKVFENYQKQKLIPKLPPLPLKDPIAEIQPVPTIMQKMAS
jgi:DNA invertase Pin-like site-specific DNA recombinase